MGERVSSPGRGFTTYDNSTVYTRLSALENEVGTGKLLSGLNTTDKTSIVNAVNEVLGDVQSNATQLADIAHNAKNDGVKPDCVLDGSSNYVSGTDNTQSFTNAINNTPSNGVLLIPAGYYYINPITVTRSNITIMGYGATLVVNMQYASPANGLNIQGSNITILGLSMQTSTIFNYDTTSKPSGTGNMLRIGSTTTYNANATVRDVKTNGGFSGGIDFQRFSNVRVLNCDVQNSLGNGINFSDCPADILVDGCTVQNTRDDGIICVADANYMQGTDNFKVVNCRVMNGYAKGIGTTGVNSGVIENNWIKNTWTGGIQIFQDTSYSLAKSRNVKIKGNTIINAGKNFGVGQYKTAVSTNNDGMYVYGDTHNVDIDGNFIFSPMRYGINVGNGAKRIKIRNNEIVACGSSGIEVGNPSDATYTSAYDITIADNKCVDLGSHGIVIGGVNEAIVTRNKIKTWLDGNRCVYAKNIKNVLFAQNIANNNITSTWSANTYFFAGQYILPATSNGHSYKCTVSGLTGSTEPTWDITGNTVTDGTITWQDNGTLLTRGIASAPPYVDAAGTNVGVQTTTDNYLLNS